MIVQTGLGVQGERGGTAMSKCLLTALLRPLTGLGIMGSLG
jgi:hypothetical protein